MQKFAPHMKNRSSPIPLAGGLSRSGRDRLGKLARELPEAFSIRDAAARLNVAPATASKVLSAWVERGWARRLGRGLYTLVPVEAQSRTTIGIDPWIVVARSFAPCYITGWAAAAYWELTDQLYRATPVVTTGRFRRSSITLGGADFVVRSAKTLPREGRDVVWRGRTRVEVATPPLMLIDMFDDPALGPGIREAALVVATYLKSSRRDDDLLLRCAAERGNGAVYKRLGYVVEQLAPTEAALLVACAKRLTQGYARLDPTAKTKGRLVRRWWLQVNVELQHPERA